MLARDGKKIINYCCDENNLWYYNGTHWYNYTTRLCSGDEEKFIAEGIKRVEVPKELADVERDRKLGKDIKRV